jgi:hypothetical protein
MAGVIKQGACPYCASHDAYTEYDDGGYHCFSCGAHLPGNEYKKMIAKLGAGTGKTVVECPALPEDSTSLIGPRGNAQGTVSPQAYAWLGKVGITDAEIDQNNMLWSEDKQLLIFPVLDEVGDILMWQGRYFGDKPRHPKYLTRGLKETTVCIIGQGKKGPLVLTEDLLSAIKVGRQQPAMPIWGSSVSSELVQRLRLIYPAVRLWLDFDKRETSVRIAVKHSLWIDIDPIITQLDPKCYTDEEIESYLRTK